jgi:two-component system, cell cycle sensor histidine kinase and response regulator CckA
VVTHRWRRGLRAAALTPPDFDDGLSSLVEELPRILVESPEPAKVFAERLAGRGATRYRQRARLRDVEREVSELEPAIVRTWAQRRGELPVDVALLLYDLMTEATVRVSRDYARACEAVEAQVRLASVMRALQRLSEGVQVLDRRGAIAMVAGPVETLLGRKPSELIGQPGRGPALQALRSGQEVAAERVRVRNAVTGEERMCETYAFPLREDGEIVGAVELLRDVTMELRHEEELRRADRELTALHARLLRRSHGQAMAELATATASTLNNELNAIAMSLSLVQKELQKPSEPTARHLYAVEQAVQRAAGLLARMQQLAARQPNAPPRAVSLNDTLMEALDLVRPELTTSSTRKAVRVDARLGEIKPVLAQPSELRELLCSLIIEAREAMAQGGALQVTTRRERDGASLLLTLPLGFDAAGDPFAGATERGVTLAAARDRARRWGGDLVVETRAGRLTVRLTLPAAPAPRTTPTGARPVPRPARRILVVDDDAGNRETLTELLALSGHDVAAADSGKSALEAVARADKAFDVALVDLAMPDMDGLELARRLRAGDPALRIALVTGWEPSAVDGHAETGLIEAIFRKPIDLPAINRFLEGAASPAPTPQPSDAK